MQQNSHRIRIRRKYEPGLTCMNLLLKKKQILKRNIDEELFDEGAIFNRAE